MAPRRSHKKSRNGCQQCKVRRVKCAENRPMCSNCTKRGISCSFEIENLQTPPIQTPNANSPPSDVPASASSYVILSRLEEIELMHYYSVHTFETIAADANGKKWSQRFLAALGIQHDFFLDALFAFTCLHLATLRPSQTAKYSAASVRYRDRALARLASVLAEPSPETCFAMFQTSVLVGIICFALPQVHPDFTSTPPTTILLETSNLWRGSHAIADMAKTLMGDAQYSAYFDDMPSLRERTYAQLPDSEETMVLLDKLTEVKLGSPFEAALKWLKEGYRTYSIDGAVVDILGWSPRFGAEFHTLLASGDSLARLVTICYGVLLNGIDGFWWARGIGRGLVEELSPKIEPVTPEWERVIDWARTGVGLPQGPRFTAC